MIKGDITHDNLPDGWENGFEIVFWPGKKYEYKYGKNSEIEIVNLGECYIVCGVTGPDGSLMLAPWSRTGNEDEPWSLEIARFVDTGEFEVRDLDGNVLATSAANGGSYRTMVTTEDNVKLPFVKTDRAR